MIEGVDYSRTAGASSPSVAQLKAQGKRFVGRYAVDDKSPGGRGITAAEYKRMTAGGIDVFLYWEGSESWMLGGFDAGVAAARNAVKNIAAAGMPVDTPVYFAHDIDPQPQHFEAIRFCVEGAASVIGWKRMGVYGGWLIIDHLAPIYDEMKFYCQTLAWMYGRGWHPAACLHQYGFNVYINGTNCDLVRATQANYGQAVVALPPPPKPQPQPVVYPRGMDAALAAKWFGTVGKYKFDEDGPVSKLWLGHGLETGKYPTLQTVDEYADSPQQTRKYFRFADGWTVFSTTDEPPRVLTKGTA